MSKLKPIPPECLLVGLKSLLTAILLCIISTYALGQQTPRVSDQGRGYLEYLPPGYESNSDLYPVMIFLHGHGERGNGSASALEAVKKNGPPKHIKNGHNMCFDVNGTTECFIVLSPQQTTNRHGWLGYEVIPFVQFALDTYRIDPDRVYLTGLSMGGQGTWQAAYAAENTPNYFAALAPAPGRGGYQEACIVAQNGTPVWAFHGSNDNAMKINEGERPIKGMNACDPDPAPIFTVYSGVGHGGTWDRAYRTDNSLHTPNLYQWLLSQRKGAPPEVPPVVNAGSNVTITLPVNTASILATANDPDGSISNISWVQSSGPNTATTTALDQLAVSLSNLIAGTYSFVITVTDNDGLTSSDQVDVIVNPEPPNTPPTVNAGSDITITLPTNSAAINATSSDSDGTIDTYLWQQTSGPNTAVMSSTTSEDINISSLIEGSYGFSLSVTDDDGATSIDNINVIVLPEPANEPPIANAGSDEEVTLPDNTVDLNGVASDSDGTITSVSWTQNSGPNTATISDPTVADITIDNLIEGAYVFEFTATDDDGDTDTDQVVVNVFPPPPNDPPTAIAGSDISVTLPTNTTTLNGSGNDTDGTITSYLWQQVSGPNSASIVALGNASTQINNLVEGVYVFSLEVTDDDADTDTDLINVTVLPVPPNNPPVVDAGSDISLTLPVNTTNFSAIASDSDGAIVSYLWEQTSGPAGANIVSPSTSDTEINSLTEGIYQFTITVQDDDGAENTDEIEITVFPVQNIPPAANAGSNIVITLPTSTANLVGTGTDSDGTIASYDWAQVTGPNTSVISNSGTASTAVSSLVEGVYTFRLTVEDNDGATDSDQVNVTVNPEPFNQPPVANAGADITLTLPDNSTTLMGNGNDPDGTIVSYVWESISGPSGTFGNLNQQNLPISELVEGIYLFDLTVEDDKGLTATDQVRVIVNASNQPPSANAGSDILITLPTNSATLQGIASDSDGSIDLTLWEQVDGPTSVTINNPLSLVATVNNLVEGVYRFNFLVQDNDGDTDSDEVRVTVNPAPFNNPPTADAGPDRQIVLPISSITLNGSGADSDGTVSSYLWTQASGPNTATSANTGGTSPTFSGLVEGVYRFRLVVTDNSGDEGEDETRVTVLPAPGNQLPSVNAGADNSIELPVNEITLAGSATDLDGTIDSYLWTQMSGPALSTIVNSSVPSTLITDLNEGIYIFRLTAIDNDGGSSFDQVIIKVDPDPANVPPAVDAGTNKIIRLPINSVAFNATSQDVDGTISSIAWTQVSGPGSATLSATDVEDITVSDLILGTYIFRITVIDNEGGVGFDQVNVRVQEAAANQPPLVSAGSNQIIIEPEDFVSLAATATDSDGSVASTLWSQVSGPSSASLSSPSSLSTDVSGLILGTYIFKLTAIDNNGLSGFDQLNVRVNPPNPNLPPSANAGVDIVITEPADAATLEGSASDDDGTVQSIEWSQIAGPGTAGFSDQSILNPTVSNLLVGVYTFRLTITDNEGSEDFDEVLLTVNSAAANQPPEVNAGNDMAVNLPNNSAQLSGTANDSDGSISIIQWTVESGPSTAIFTSEDALSTSIVDLVTGTYVVRLTATDNVGASSFDELTIFVSDNILPSAFAGEDVKLIFPDNSTTLTGNGADTDGTIIQKEWQQVRGPNDATITILDENRIDISDLIIGLYEFSFTVVDDRDAENTDVVLVEVISPNGNELPIVNAGEDITINIPENAATLRGEANDPDGRITSYSWEQVEGEPAVTSDPNFEEITVGGLKIGTYTFKLTAFDNGGLFASDEVSIFVLPLQLSSLKIPKLYTPNNDGVNDVWEIENIGALENCKITIYSSTGLEILKASPYQNDWGGTYKGGELAAGAYYYVIECGSEQRTGGVRIIR